MLGLPTHTRTVSAVRYLGAELEGVIVSEAVDICRDGPSPTFKAGVCGSSRSIFTGLLTAERDLLGVL